MWSLHITVCLAAGIIVNSGSDSGTHVARQTLTVSEAPFDSRLITFLPDQRVMLKHNNETRTLTLQDLVVWGSYTDHNSLPHVYLTDGGVLAADVVKITPAQVTLYSRIFTEVQIPRSLLRAIVFAPPAGVLPRDHLWKQILSNTVDHDTAHFTNGDALRGKHVTTPNTLLTNVTNRIAFQTEQRPTPLSIPLERLSALLFRSQKPRNLRAESRQQTPAGVSLGFADGSRIHVNTIVTKQKKIQLTVNQELMLSVDAATFHRELTQFQPRTPQVTFLSDLTPSSYKHIPFLRRSWPHGIDENVLGGRLRCAGAIHTKGLGMHSASRITYQLDHKFRWFQSQIALDQSAGNRGSVIFRVFLQRSGEWTSTYTSPIVRGANRPLAIKLNVAQADAIALLVEFADRGDERDYANWLNARLSN